MYNKLKNLSSTSLFQPSWLSIHASFCRFVTLYNFQFLQLYHKVWLTISICLGSEKYARTNGQFFDWTEWDQKNPILEPAKGLSDCIKSQSYVNWYWGKKQLFLFLGWFVPEITAKTWARWLNKWADYTAIELDFQL